MEKPALPKGTRDFGPVQMTKRQFIFNIIRSVFQKYGFLPLETPAMENLENLTGKYGEEGDQLLFKILDNGDFLKEVDDQKLASRNVKLITPHISGKGLKYDLTVPFARYVVMNRGEITLPFKRYQIQPVWRADRPQRGRYREFYQCDADVVGTDSLVNEAEIILMIQEVFRGLGLTDYTIKINHRGVLSGLAESARNIESVEAGLTPTVQTSDSSLFMAIDKLDKIGEEKVADELRSKGFSDINIKQVFETLKTTGENSEKIQKLQQRFTNSESGKKGLNDLEEVFRILGNFTGKPTTNNQQPSTSNIEFDISLARGLSYYTGTIFEVKVNNVAIGSVSGGGRYDNLTQSFGSKEKLSGVGISFGIDRLYDVLEELKLFPLDAMRSSKVLVAHFDQPSMIYGLRICQTLRNNGIASEIYPDVTKLKKQLEYADKKHIEFALIIGPDEMESGILSLKNLTDGTQEKFEIDKVIEKLKL